MLIYRELIELSGYELDKRGQITKEGVEEDFRFLNVGVWNGDASW